MRDKDYEGGDGGSGDSRIGGGVGTDGRELNRAYPENVNSLFRFLMKLLS